MVMKVDVKAFRDLASDFGPEGTRFFLDATEAATKIATETAAVSLERCTARHWPNSRIRHNIKTGINVSQKAIVGFVLVKHKWVSPLILGEDVPGHRIPRSGEKIMVLRWEKGYAGSPGARRKIDPRTGKSPVRRLAKHPGYKGRDCASPAQTAGTKAFMRKVQRATLMLARRLAGK